MLKLTPEETLLFLTCGPSMSKSAKKRLRRVVNFDLDWAYILWRAETYQTLPLVRFHLKNLSLWGCVPTAIQEYINNWSALSRARSSQQFKELCRIVGALNENNIDYFLLKGAAFSLTIYPDPLLRPMQDIDLMIYPQDARRAQKLLYSIGYRHGVFNPANGRFTHIPKKITGRLLRTEHELPSMTFYETIRSPVSAELVLDSWRKRQLKCYVHRNQTVTMPVFLDLHINLSEGLDLADVWRGVSKSVIYGRVLQFQSPTAALWFTIVRLYHEAFEYSTLKLGMLGDAQAILVEKSLEIDWAEILVMANKYDMCAPLFYVLSQIAKLTSISIPEIVLNEISPDPLREPDSHDLGDVFPKLFSRAVVQEITLA